MFTEFTLHKHSELKRTARTVFYGFNFNKHFSVQRVDLSISYHNSETTVKLLISFYYYLYGKNCLFVK